MPQIIKQNILKHSEGNTATLNGCFLIYSSYFTTVSMWHQFKLRLFQHLKWIK